MNNASPDPGAATLPAAESWRQRHRRTVGLVTRVALALLSVLAAGWWLLLAPIPVVAHAVATGTVTAEVLGTGTLEARTAAIVGSEIGGLIVEMAVDQGDRVKAGDRLFQLEASDIRQQVGMAESEVAAARATLERLAAARRGAEAVLAHATTNHQRTRELIASQVASGRDLDVAFEALAVAEAGLSVASAAIIEGQKKLSAAERALEYQRARLQDTTILAPFDGMVVRRDRQAGDVVTPGASVLQLVSTDQMWITAWVDETALAGLAEGQSARVVFRSEPHATYRGVVARVGREVDRETRQIVTDVLVRQLPVRWAVGQRAEVYIEVGRAEAVTTVPAALVSVRDGIAGVMVDVGGRARWRRIELGLRGLEQLEVTAGLQPGELVVIPAAPGSESLRDGQGISQR